MENFDRKKHWEDIYQTKELKDVSWYQPNPQTSLDFIKKYEISTKSKIIDIGGGDSFLVDHLVELGFQDITVLDISEAAIERAKYRLGVKAKNVTWIVEDVINFQPAEKYDFWHDRAVFHFLTNEEDRKKYVRQVMRSVKHGGHVIISTFGLEGPDTCSGLDVIKYDADSLHTEFGKTFQLIESSTEIHNTPFGTTQQFLYCYCRME